MSFSPMAPKRTCSAPELVAALREAGEASSLAQASDLDSIGEALSRLETATSLLREIDPRSQDHALLRAEIDRAGFAARRLFEEMIAERDRLGEEIATAARARRDQAKAPQPSLDLTL